MNEAHNSWHQTHRAVVAKVWDTSDPGEREAFAYYREAICAAFMPLRPEIDRAERKTFHARVASYQFGGGILNRVSASSHTVCKGKPEIAASPEDCFYLNFQRAGECRIAQGPGSVVLLPGDIGLFDGAEIFDLAHAPSAGLKVDSLMIPKRVLRDRDLAFSDGASKKLARHSAYGALLGDCFNTFSSMAAEASQGEIARLYEALLSLTFLASAAPGPERGSTTRREANYMRVIRAIRLNHAKPDYAIAECARAVGLSVGYIRNLFTLHDDSFGRCLLRERVKQAARLLSDPHHAHLPAYAVAFAAGFKDASHFGRAFREAFGCAPAE